MPKPTESESDREPSPSPREERQRRADEIWANPRGRWIAGAELVRGVLPVTGLAGLFLVSMTQDSVFTQFPWIMAILLAGIAALVACWATLLFRILGRYPRRWALLPGNRLVVGMILGVLGFLAVEIIVGEEFGTEARVVGSYVLLAPVVVAVHQLAALFPLSETD